MSDEDEFDRELLLESLPYGIFEGAISFKDPLVEKRRYLRSCYRKEEDEHARQSLRVVNNDAAMEALHFYTASHRLVDGNCIVSGPLSERLFEIWEEEFDKALNH